MSNTYHTPIFKEARRLHKLGFAVLWLHPKSKRPIGNAWGSGPRKPWEELQETYQPGFNVGVRLGGPSEIAFGFVNRYLAVIDVDVKSTEPHHRKEAMAAVKKLLGGTSCPEVRSGRGNGSRHYYCVTNATFKTFNPFQSEETVAAHMPSKNPSKRDLAELSDAEVKAGMRMTRAWEISLYSDGRQVVLPPSIHPDTGKPYFWVEPILNERSLPCLEFEVPPAEEKTVKRKSGERVQSDTVEDFEIDESLDIRWLPNLDDGTRKLIVSGLWNGKKVEDRSAYLIPAANGLVSAGLDKNGVLTVLTDRTTYLGQCAFDHAQTDSRKRAAQWLWSYTVKRVMRERDPSTAFSGVAIVTDDVLDEEAEGKQSSEIEEESDWKQYLQKTKDGNIRATFLNCKTILENVCSKSFLWRNEFANNDFYTETPPWGSRKGDAVRDVDVDRIKDYSCIHFGVEFNNQMIEQVLRVIADKNRSHPVRDWVIGLEWDGVPRIDTWMKDYLGATGPDAYMKAVSRKILVALVKRVFEPGCKFDHVLILEGIQGAGKSTLLSNLVGEPWFTDQPIILGEKDSVMTMQSKWLIELGELSVLSKSDIEGLKAFITQRTDRIRLPYGRRTEDFPRQCIFVGSTNKDEYLKDETGNRRFWPVRCGAEIRFKEIALVREQLFAEAFVAYEKGEPIFLETKEMNELAKMEQENRSEGDEWISIVRDIVEGEVFPRNQFEMRDVAKLMDQVSAHRLSPHDQQRIGKCLRALGFEKFQEGVSHRRKLWRPKARTEPNQAEPRPEVPPKETKRPQNVSFL